MDKITERETQDLMNVESFSQLPFIRPAPPIKEKGIRLFGIEFGGAAATTEDSESMETTNNNNMNNGFDTDSTTINKDKNNNNNKSNNSTENNVESNRRFECHYCCRNFPTSQALGGHQNAHKRERQHAKRAHLQSTMVHATSFTSDPHLYQHHHHNPFINYRFTSSSSSPTTCPTWNSNNSSNSLINGSAARFYGTHSHSHAHANIASSYSQQQQPINGSPLAFWRVPNGVVQSNPSFNNNHERSFQIQPLLAADEKPSSFSQVGVGQSASQNRYLYDSKRTTVDHVSLDLHL